MSDALRCERNGRRPAEACKSQCATYAATPQRTPAAKAISQTLLRRVTALLSANSRVLAVRRAAFRRDGPRVRDHGCTLFVHAALAWTTGMAGLSNSSQHACEPRTDLCTTICTRDGPAANLRNSPTNAIDAAASRARPLSTIHIHRAPPCCMSTPRRISRASARPQHHLVAYVRSRIDFPASELCP